MSESLEQTSEPLGYFVVVEPGGRKRSDQRNAEADQHQRQYLFYHHERDLYRLSTPKRTPDFYEVFEIRSSHPESMYR